MPVRQIDPENRGERKRFVLLEQELVGAEPLFVTEVASDVHKRVRGRSPFYEKMEHALFIASNGRDVARCAAFVNRRWQREKGDTAGFIGYFAAARLRGTEWTWGFATRRDSRKRRSDRHGREATLGDVLRAER